MGPGSAPREERLGPSDCVERRCWMEHRGTAWKLQDNKHTLLGKLQTHHRHLGRDCPTRRARSLVSDASGAHQQCQRSYGVKKQTADDPDWQNSRFDVVDRTWSSAGNTSIHCYCSYHYDDNTRSRKTLHSISNDTVSNTNQIKSVLSPKRPASLSILCHFPLLRASFNHRHTSKASTPVQPQNA